MKGTARPCARSEGRRDPSPAGEWAPGTGSELGGVPRCRGHPLPHPAATVFVPDLGVPMARHPGRGRHARLAHLMSRAPGPGWRSDFRSGAPPSPPDWSFPFKPARTRAPPRRPPRPRPSPERRVRARSPGLWCLRGDQGARRREARLEASPSKEKAAPGGGALETAELTPRLPA